MLSNVSALFPSFASLFLVSLESWTQVISSFFLLALWLFISTTGTIELNRTKPPTFRSLGLKCKKCKTRNLVSIYINDKESSSKKPIGKICLECDPVPNPTEYFQKIYDEILEEKKTKLAKKPKFPPKNESCIKCGSKRIKIRKHKESIRIAFDKGQQVWQCNKNNPHISYTCKKCGQPWSHGLQMPVKPKYTISPKLTKEQLRLVLQHTIREELQVPKNLNKMVVVIQEEFEQQRRAKTEREKSRKTFREF